MEFTGERMVPEKADAQTFWEHIYRYRFATPFVAGKRVLDIACGEGYGAAAMVRSGATKVIGVDVSSEAVAHAAKKYGLDIRIGDAQKIPLANQSVDVVVSFETIEHLIRPDLFLDECVRVLSPGGKIVISTPNRDVYREKSPHNPYHLKELNEPEFTELLSARFRDIQLFTQRPKSAAWWSVRGLASEQTIWRRRGFGRLRRLIRMGCCREIVNSKTLERARENPIQTITTHRGGFSSLANPFAIRPKSRLSRETPIYIIAVATL